MISENKVRERIKQLEDELKSNEERYYSLNPNSYTENEIRRNILMKCYNIESQLDALYYVLGEKYFYKHK